MVQKEGVVIQVTICDKCKAQLEEDGKIAGHYVRIIAGTSHIADLCDSCYSVLRHWLYDEKAQVKSD